MPLSFYMSGQFLQVSELTTIARAAEEAGLDGIALSDHLFLSDQPSSAYPYTSDGSLPFARDVHWPDVWVTIGALGAATTTLRFLTHVYILPLRNPLVVAKAAATAGAFAPGRVSMGIGVGWLRDEFDAVDLSFERRGARTDESIAVLREIWSTGSLQARHNEHFDFPGLAMYPLPPAPIPILIGGESNSARNRAARIGDGFLSLPHPVDELLDIIADVRHRVAEANRDPGDFLVNARCVDPNDIAGFDALDRADVTSVNLTLWEMDTTLDEKLAAIERFGTEVLAPFRGGRS
jgi:probable F420-dependent oxidoreductase